MKTTWITGLCGVVLVGLTACGPLYDGVNSAELTRSLLGNFGGDDSSAQAASTEAATPSVLTREVIEAFGAPVLRISVISLEATGLLYRVGENGTKVTWINDETMTFTFDDGLAVGTRGLGDDLMGSDVAGAKRSFHSGGSHMRTLDFLNSLAQIERKTYECQTVQTGRETITIYERRYATTVFDETCTGEYGDFKNTYWRDSNGVIWQSRQWISAGIGYIGYQRL
ncbi:MAG: YjbF family lipoprotein [Octadecabacter sp.]